MTCREFADFIADYAADELPEPIRASFELHLQRCANCREYLALYLTTVELARSMSREEDRETSRCGVPEDLVSAILVARAQAGAAG
jgi:predicted anti-sigma-YlaC factor YlaD